MERRAGGERGARVAEREGGLVHAPGLAGLMRFRVLGPLEVLTEDEWQSIGARKWRSLLAALLLNAGQIVSVDTLIDVIWGEEPPAKAPNLVSIYVLRLRRLIGDPEGRVLVTRSPGYFIRAEPGDVDAARFEELVAEGRDALAAKEPERAASVLRDALALWRGSALADVPPSTYIDAEAERLGELKLAAAELRIEADLECGRYAAVIPELRGMLAGNQIRERLWLLLMRALDGDGRRAEALEAYARAREAIADQLGVDPGAELRRLHQDLLTADRVQRPVRRRASWEIPIRPEPPSEPEAPPEEAPAGPEPPAGQDEPIREGKRTPESQRTEADGDEEPLPVGSVTVGSVPASTAPPPDPRPPAVRPAQLPADIGDFTGREALVEHLCWLLTSRNAMDSPGAVPVAVVAGSGGLGKTSLAVHAAHRLTRDYPDGQLYVDLFGASAHPQAPSDVLARFLRDLGVEQGQMPVTEEERAALYRTRLAGRRVLVLLDNARDAAQVRPLLPGSSSCGVLVTARSRMPDLAPSKLVDLEVLDDDESLTLFTRIVGEKRAAAEPESTAEVLVACAGLPLAIRICAARLAARSRWSIRTLAERLRDEHRRLDEMTAGDMAVRASFQVSLTALPSSVAGVDPGVLFRLLGLWPGPFIALNAAAALYGGNPGRVEEALEILVDACLLESPAPGRYQFHDLLRVYAGECAQTPEIQQLRGTALSRVFEWYLYTADAAAAVISPNRTRVPLDPPAEDNRPLRFTSLSRAFEWCEEERQNIVAVSRQAAAERLDSVAWQLPAAAMTFFNRRGYRGDWIGTHRIAVDAARRAGDQIGEAVILNNLGMAYRDLSLDDAVANLREAIAVGRKAGDLRSQTQAAANLADTYRRGGRYAEVIAMYQEVLDNLRLLHNRYGEGIVLTTAAEAHLGLGNVDEAVGLLNQARKIYAEIDEQRGEVAALLALGEAYLERGQPEEGLASLRQALEIARSAGERVFEAETFKRLGLAYSRVGQPMRAKEALTEAYEAFSALGDVAGAAEVEGELKRLEQ